MTNSTLAELLAGGPTPVAKVCKFGAYLAGLNTGDRMALDEALDDWAWSSAQLHRIVRDNGCAAGSSVLVEHRAGRCICTQSTEKAA